MSLNPRLASQAPNVSIIILIVAMGIFNNDIENGIIATNVSIIPSRENRDIRKC